MKPKISGKLFDPWRAAQRMGLTKTEFKDLIKKLEAFNFDTTEYVQIPKLKRKKKHANKS